MEKQNTKPRKVVGYFRVGNANQLDAGQQQSHIQEPASQFPRMGLDNSPEEVDDIDIEESDLTPDLQMGG